jgi:hypothetical protein
MKFKNLILGTALLVGSLSTANASVIVIDDFTTAQGPVTVTADRPNVVSSGWVQSVNGSGIIGGYRDMRVTALGNSLSNNDAEMEVFENSLSMSSNSGVRARFDLRWDGVNDTDAIATNGLTNFDMTQANGTNFLTPIISADLDAWFSVTFWSDQNDDGVFADETRFLYIPGHSALEDDGNTPTDPRQSFFSSLIFGQTNFGKVGAIEVSANIMVPSFSDTRTATTETSATIRTTNVNGILEPRFFGTNVDDWDARVQGISAVEVSEPAMASLLGLGLAGLMFARRRKAKATA